MSHVHSDFSRSNKSAIASTDSRAKLSIALDSCTDLHQMLRVCADFDTNNDQTTNKLSENAN